MKIGYKYSIKIKVRKNSNYPLARKQCTKLRYLRFLLSSIYFSCFCELTTDNAKKKKKTLCCSYITEILF